jgi:hypothetical protein
MEAMLGISLNSFLHLKLEKHYVYLIISYVFSSTKLENKRAEQVLPVAGVGGQGIRHTHVNNCINDKIFLKTPNTKTQKHCTT